ncbi:trypsin-like cysteine/serine peptidase domain-containing protein [Gigaspora rosea]|uniref:Trypsin-like cysteine/serine peptidase domain-containing protein n=1 Tax=Gigaspora rosea TaxID=44941 RepID=A0A397UL40_9GLOM|nr:trypsin-like cysteine/serine peptidase domain-containing protein [Gigaspora rosea]
MNLEKRNAVVTRILAGDGLYIFDKINKMSYTCTAGFWARSKQNINYIATAGHCYVPASGPFYLYPWNSTSVSLIGEMNAYLLEPIDFGLISINNTNIQPIPCVRNSDSEQYKELFIADVISVSNNGAHLCLSGLYSHVRCGYVAALNGFFSYGEFFFDNIFVANLRYITGDSGGPIFYHKNLTHVSLNGILMGGLFDFNDNTRVLMVLLEL